MKPFFVFLTILTCVVGRANAAQRPNLVVIMADDMGYTDIGCYGSEIQTPVLDDLAANGLRFTQFYNTSRCCPTRASLLTGLYSHQAGIGLMTSDRGYDAYRGDLNRRCVTIAEALRPVGYRSYMAGKWHVTRHVGPKADNANWPLQRGFDRFYGTITGAGSFYDPATLCRGNTYITPENDPEYQPEQFYYTDAISDHAARYVADHFRDHADEPFFLYVAYTSAHWPMHAPQSDIAKYDGLYDQGYEPIRNARHRKAIAQGVLSDRWPLSNGAIDWEGVPHRDWEIRCMEVYAAMVDRMDQGIGRIIKQLRQAGALDNTLVVYLQDNGGCAEGYGRRNNDDRKADFDFKPFGPNDLQTKIWPPMQTRDGRWVRTGPTTMPGEEDTFVAYGTGWANVSNTPFRGYKHDGYEGGISTPFIVHWPDGIGREWRGQIVKTPSHLIDLMPTFLDLAGATYPRVVAGQAIQPMEGVSLVPALSGKSIGRDKPIGFEHHGNLALRDGRWKIVSAYRRDQPTKWELYDMENDRTEGRDLALQHPQRLRTMVAQWQAWADRVGVQPWPLAPKPATRKPTASIAPGNRWQHPSATRFEDPFEEPHDFLGKGTSQTGWDGMLGLGTDQTADRIAAADGRLWLQSSRGRYQEPWRPLGPFLYKTLSGDFRATVKVTDYERLSFNNGGIMARAASPEDAGKGEDWISIDYFPIYGGIYARLADDNRRSEPSNNGQGTGADPYLRLERLGHQFFLSHSPDGVHWQPLPGSPFTRDDLTGIPLQVGLFQATYSDHQGQIGFDHFTLEQLPPVSKARNSFPAHGQERLPPTLSLAWIPGHDAQYHEVYLGTSRESVASATPETESIYRGRFPATQTSLLLNALADGQNYYWRIDEGTDHEKHRGEIWSFKTYERTIATFEGSTATEPLRPRWELMGEGDLEKTREHSHSGRAALRFTSRRPGAEATLTLKGDHDWNDSANPFKSLRLYLRGAPGNDLEQISLALEDNDWQSSRATIALDNTDALGQDRWTRWEIDLQQFVSSNPALRLGKIRKLSLGLVGRGTIWIDDLALESPPATPSSSISGDRLVQTVPFHRVRVTGGLWRERMDVNRQVSLPHVWSRCEDSITGDGRASKRLDNFRKAGGSLEGDFSGTYFNDSDVYKILEGTAHSLRNQPNNELEAYADQVIDWIESAQWDDGYLFTFYSLPERQPQRRWTDIGGQHELYCAGHLIEAAIAYHEATGKRKLLDVALRFANLICATFGPGKLETAPGHQEIELALLKLYEATGETRFKDTARFFIDQRGRDGHRRLYGTYSQDHQPFFRQEKAVGHSVRATYLFSAATDLARLDGDAAYANALFRLWDDIVNTKTYLTGGIGQPGGPEGFAGAYQLGNACYAETCSGIGFALWNHRMHRLTGESRYADLIERILLNNMLASLSFRGDRHAYTNPLTTEGRERWEWPDHDCACCPSNLVRVLSSIGGYIYSHNADTILINQYIANSGTVDLASGQVGVTQKTNYPWSGTVTIEVEPARESEFEIKLRIPCWARNQPLPGHLYRYLETEGHKQEIILEVNEAPIPVNIDRGYVSIRRSWRPGDTLQLHLPMPVRRVVAHPKATANKGLVALERGPIVYCAEFKDNDIPVSQLALSDDSVFQTRMEPDFFQGAVTLTSGDTKFIPYFLYANRGPGWMRVWIPRENL